MAEAKEKPKYTFCSHCGKICDGKIQGRFILCRFCGISIPIGSRSFYKLKGGTEKNMEKQEKKADNATVVKVASKEVLMEAGQNLNDLLNDICKGMTTKEKLKAIHYCWLKTKSE